MATNMPSWKRSTHAQRGWMSFTWALVAGALATACMAHQSAAERLTHAARELNNEARFGRMSVAAQHASPTGRTAFLERRQLWGNEIRVMDVQLTGVAVEEDGRAELMVEYAWTRMDEGVLRTTAIKQSWTNEDQRGWKLEREQRAGGDTGLFGEHAVNRYVEPRGDVHFPSKSLGLSR